METGVQLMPMSQPMRTMTWLFSMMARVFSIPDTSMSQLHLSTQLKKLEEASSVLRSCAGHLEILNATRCSSQLHDVPCLWPWGTSMQTGHCMNNAVRDRTKTITIFLSESPRQVLDHVLHKLAAFNPWVPVKEVYYLPPF